MQLTPACRATLNLRKVASDNLRMKKAAHGARLFDLDQALLRRVLRLRC
jgi:hypothetical protein